MKNIFPTLRLNKENTYLDNAASSLKIKAVIKSISNFYNFFSLNNHSFSENIIHNTIEKTINETRVLISNWINGKPSEISFIPSATYGLNILALSVCDFIKNDDLILITKLEHSSNIYPWINICNKKGAKIDYFDLNEQFQIDEKKIAERISKKVKVVSFSHVSNNVGSLNNVYVISNIIKKKNPDCFIIIDASQSISSELIDVRECQIDALVFSAHKVYGPTGIGVLWVKSESEKKLPHILWGGGKIISPLSYNQNNSSLQQVSYNKFEVGSLPLAQIFGLKEVFLFLNSINWKKKKKKEKELLKYAVLKMSEIQNIKIYNKNLSNNIIGS